MVTNRHLLKADLRLTSAGYGRTTIHWESCSSGREGSFGNNTQSTCSNSFIRLGQVWNILIVSESPADAMVPLLRMMENKQQHTERELYFTVGSNTNIATGFLEGGLQ